MTAFAIVHYAHDGEVLGSSQFVLDNLSQKWLQVCTDLLERHGPFFSTDMGSTLSHFHVRFLAGLCECSVRQKLAFSFVVLPEAPRDHGERLLQSFVSQIESALPKNQPASWLAEVNYSAVQRPAILIVNWLNPEIEEQESHAMFQLAYHYRRRSRTFVYKSTR